MRKIIATEYVTVDGIMEAPDKWSFQFWSDESAKFKFEELFSSGALLLGRVTYEGFAAAWPTMKDEQGFADRMNSLPKYVVSTTLQTAEWNNTKIVSGDVVEEIKKLKEEDGQDILLAGSADLLHTLIEADLVDELRLMTHPVVYGKGKKLFRNDVNEKVLKLTDSKVFASGIVVLIYKPIKK